MAGQHQIAKKPQRSGKEERRIEAIAGGDGRQKLGRNRGPTQHRQISNEGSRPQNSLVSRVDIYLFTYSQGLSWDRWGRGWDEAGRRGKKVKV